MGKILLFAGVDPVSTGESDYPWHPLSVLAVGSALRAAGHDPVVIDCQVQPDWRTRLAADAPSATYVGVTCMTGPSIANVLEAITIVRQCAPATPVVWGGYHATLAYRGILREHLADVVVIGAGEQAAVSLAQIAAGPEPTAVTNPAALEQIPNIAYLDGRRELTLGGTSSPRVHVTRSEALPDMNTLAPLDYSLISVRDYYTDTMKDISYITSYGCPHACSFCSEPITSGRRWKPLAPARVADELIDLWQQYQPDQISLLDPNFSTNTARVIEIVEALERRGVRIELRANMRTRDIVRLARELDLRRLQRVGFSAIFVGCESGSDRMLTRLRKGATVQDTIDACALLSAAGITQLTSWIHDLPDETEDDSAATLRLVRDLAALDHNEQKHHFFTPFPATELYDQVFGPTRDQGQTQAEWASSSTYGPSSIWSGRTDFRERVLGSLVDLQSTYPHVLRRNLPGTIH